MQHYDLVILDSGVNLDCSNIDCMTYTGQGWKKTIMRNDKLGHGTSVLSLISSQYKVCVFQLDGDNVFDDYKKVFDAFQYIIEHLTCRFLLMSNGFISYNRQFEHMCDDLTRKGIIIISAFGNQGAVTYPAAFESVIGVQGNPYIKNRSTFYVLQDSIIDVEAKSSAFNFNNQRYLYGNSFAAAYVASKLLSADRSVQTKKEALQYLMNSEVTTNIQECAILPLNKENYNLLYNADLLQYKITKVYDIKYASNIGKVINSLHSPASFLVENIEKINWNSFDTMIIGHLHDFSKLIGRNLKIELLDSCLRYHKNVICYDTHEINNYINLFKHERLRLVYPKAIKNTNQGKLYEFQTPIIAVVGTSRNQCKFTLQLQIIRVLKSAGVNVGMMGTEPNSELLGADASLAIGYDSIVNNISGYELLSLINMTMHIVDKKNKDIIITGAQSSFLPQYEFNLNQINLDSFAFLYGTKPDACILTVNISDSTEFIKRNIAALENLTNCKVILIALNPFYPEFHHVINNKRKKINDTDLLRFKESIKNIKLPIILIGDEKYNDELLATIIMYFQ